MLRRVRHGGRLALGRGPRGGGGPGAARDRPRLARLRGRLAGALPARDGGGPHGRRPFVKLDVLHRENLEATLADFGVTGLPEAVLADLNLAWHRLDPWPDAVEGLARLRQRHILAPLSNGNVRLMVDLARRGGLPWDAILGAEVARAYKPSPEAYLRSAELLDLPPSACVMVAAHNGDLAAARAVGFRTAFVPRPLEHGPGQTSDLEPAEAWDVVARDFGELAERLGC